MADKISAIKIKQPNGSYSDQIPISVLVQNVQWDQDHSLLDALGSVDLSSSGKGNLQHQIDELDEDKISHDDFNSQLDEFLSQQIREDTESWLEENVNTGQTIGLTTNLTISGLAADAKAVGDAIDAKTFPIDSTLSDSSTNPVQNKVVTSAISELNGSLENFFVEEAELVSTTSANYALKGDGRYISDANSELVKYRVVAGDMLHLSLSADNAGVYQWQNTPNVPSTLNPSVIVGTPVKEATDKVVEVPTGATYLIVSQLKSNTTNAVKKVLFKFNERQDMQNTPTLTVEGVVYGSIANGSDTISKNVTADCRIVYYKATAGDYIVSKTQASNAFTVAVSESIPEPSVIIKNVIRVESETEVAVSIKTDGYILVYCYYNDDTDFKDIIDSINVKPFLVVSELSNQVGELEILQNVIREVSGKSVGKIITTDGVIAKRIIVDNGSNSASGLSTCVLIDPSWKKIYIEAQENHGVYYAFLKKTLSDGQAPSYSDKVTGRKTVLMGSYAVVDVPSDAIYLYIQVTTMNLLSNLLPRKIYYYSEESGGSSQELNLLEGLNDTYNSIGFVSDANGRDIPQSIGVLNAYKKAKQLNGIEWTSLAAIPTDSSPTGSAAGTHTGMIYSEALQFGKYVPYGCSIKSFMTAIHNPYSVMYTEDTKGTSARKKSAYGFNYLNTTLNGAFYGTVCSAYVAWSLGINWIAQSYDYEWLSNSGEFILVKDNSATGVRLMDVLWVPGHVQIVTDIYRDNRGNPTQIYVSESAHDYVRTVVRDAEYVTNYLKNGKIYRYRKLYENLEYEPSEFVAVEGETIGQYMYNEDICTYLGDCVSIADWENMFINYSKGEYTSMELYKENTLLQTITLPAEYNTTHSIDVTSYLNGGGEYKARLTDGTNHSDYTYFEVIDTSVTASLASSGILTVNFTSDNGEPLYARMKELNGHVLSTYLFSEQEKVAGTCSYNPETLRTDQGRNKSNNKQYVRVFFQGKYNQVMGDYVDSGLT